MKILRFPIINFWPNAQGHEFYSWKFVLKIWFLVVQIKVSPLLHLDCVKDHTAFCVILSNVVHISGKLVWCCFRKKGHTLIFLVNQIVFGWGYNCVQAGEITAREIVAIVTLSSNCFGDLSLIPQWHCNRLSQCHPFMLCKGWFSL